MTNPDFVYTTYIKTTPEKLWAALTHPEFTKQYWADGITSDWKKGSEWKLANKGSTKVVGKVLESLPPKRLVVSWAEPENPKDHSRVTYELEQIGEVVKLNVVHGEFTPGSLLPAKISQGWPLVLCSLKSMLESGKALDTWGIKTCGNEAA